MMSVVGGRRAQVWGIVGGIASGKSFVAAELGRLGALVIDADRLGHEALREPEVERLARERWGEAIFGPAGRIDRKRLAKIVFAPGPQGSADLTYLEQLTHPRIKQAIARRLETAAANESGGGATTSAATPRAIALDAPVLFKAGWDEHCDQIIFVDAPREVRLARAMARGWTEEDFKRREAAQDSVDDQRLRADVTIDASGDERITREAVERLWLALAPADAAD